MIEKLELFEKSKARSAPRFWARANMQDMTGFNGIRAYFHEAGIETAFGNTATLAEGLKHLRSVLVRHRKGLGDADFILAAVWGSQRGKEIDLFKYDNTLSNWPGNPDVSSYRFTNGILKPEEKQITCGDTLMILGLEEQYRRTTDRLSTYIQTPPRIAGQWYELEGQEI